MMCDINLEFNFLKYGAILAAVYPGISQKCVQYKLKKAFLHFLPNLMIFQRFAASSVRFTLKNHQIWQIFGKNKIKICHDRLAFNPFFLVPENRILGTRSATTA